MGCSQSYPGLTEDVLEDYTVLTYLNKDEILHVMKRFYSINPAAVDADHHHRFHQDEIVTKFPVLRNNPFCDRLFHVFSSRRDKCFSFEDMLDLCSVMSDECPVAVKATWAFRIFDIDEDNQISEEDIGNILDRLTWDPDNPGSVLSGASKKKISDIILKEMQLHIAGSMGQSEFQLIISRISEFSSSFYFRV